MNHDAHRGTGNRKWLTPLIFVGFAAIAVYFLVSEHRLHTLSVLPWALILLACPLMHLFMHRGHGGHDGPSDRPRSDAVDSGSNQH
ncbi:DUF2933 domain-containing protein [Tardiphaga sp.]|uniref:DUF2933 domain-containing protein n=1 Tax=Tardiphaga sp. TaxID=1926292 RepID=UPI00352A015A